MTYLPRLIKVLNVVAAYRLDEFLRGRRRVRLLRLLLRLYRIPFSLSRTPPGDRNARLRQAMEVLGPVYIKFGQLLSTRRDFLAPELADELQLLQDQVPPFEQPPIDTLVSESLEMPASEVFSELDPEPLASASVAQVHAAVLHSGEEVVVKVIRPGVGETIAADINLLKQIAALIDRNFSIGRRLRIVEVVRDYEKTITDELNLLLEAASTTRLRANFENSDKLYVPRVYSEHSRRNLMVMERMHGIPVTDVQALNDAGVNLRKLAENGVAVFFTQVLEHNFFHADMHPGNIFVDREHSERPSYIAVDFGIMGSLSPQDQRYLAENFLAFFNRDYRRVAELHVQSGWVPRDTRENEFEAAIRAVCEPIFERPLKEISFGRLLVRLFQTARRFNMEVQPQLLLMQKTLLSIEGLGRQFYPDLDLWQTAKPFLEQWMDEQIGRRALWREVKKQAPRWGEVLPALPELVHEVLRQARNGELRVEMSSPELRRLRRDARRANQRTVLAVIGSALILSSAALLATPSPPGPALWGAPLLAWLAGLPGVYMVLVAWIGDDVDD